MREIKFRSWNGKWMQRFDFSRRNVHRNLNKGYPIMQFTGLKDKNAKEIYEGDVVRLTAEGTYYNSPDKYEECNVDKTYIGEVVIIASKGACLKRPSYTDNITGDKDKSDQYINVVQYRSEVIGNIYENPELLKCD